MNILVNARIYLCLSSLLSQTHISRLPINLMFSQYMSLLFVYITCQITVHVMIQFYNILYINTLLMLHLRGAMSIIIVDYGVRTL